MMFSCRARRVRAPFQYWISVPFWFTALGDIIRQHCRQLRSVTGCLSCVCSMLQSRACRGPSDFRWILASFSQFYWKTTESKRQFSSKMGKNTVKQKRVNWLRVNTAIQFYSLNFTVFFANYASEFPKMTGDLNILLSSMIWEFARICMWICIWKIMLSSKIPIAD